MKKMSKIHKIKEKIIKGIISRAKRVRGLIGNTTIQKGIVVILIAIAVIITAIKIYRCYTVNTLNTSFAFLVSFVDAFDAIDIVACIAAGMVWIELRQNKIINEAQLVKDINNEFINNPQLSMVERALEVYYDKYRRAKSDEERSHIRLNLCLAIDSEDRQSLVNYLVHLEAVASLVNNGALRLDSINDLVAYRFFIAVNNPVVQEYELEPYKDYYGGCFKLYKKWSGQMETKNVEIPMKECGNIFTEENDTNKL